MTELDIVHGNTQKHAASQSLVQAIADDESTSFKDGTLYLGYPILKGSYESKTVDGLFVSPSTGVVLFDIDENTAKASEVDISSAEDRQSDLEWQMKSIIQQDKHLRTRNEIRVGVTAITYYSRLQQLPGRLERDAHFATASNLSERLSRLDEVEEDTFRALVAVVQRVVGLSNRKPSRDTNQEDSKGAKLDRIETEIANLDHYQNRAAVETPEGPQRIRGLAGSGKTIVLALKAAYLHAQQPDWDIVVTFHTRSLQQQLRRLIKRFYNQHTFEAPDWEKLQILPSWGGYSSKGLYAQIGKAHDMSLVDFKTASDRYGRDYAFQGVCEEMVEELEEDDVDIEQLYDVVLIDEAQDFPSEFFQLAYHATKEPKRIIWAYDELQNLGKFTMGPAEDLFGEAPDGEPRVSLENESGQPKQDIVLRKCYRNSPWTLVTAHALGFGIYSEDGPVQLFHDTSLWRDIGYEIISGDFEVGKEVSLRRDAEATPEFFGELMDEHEAISCHSFETRGQQYQEVAQRIEADLEQDELKPNDVLVILSNPKKVKTRGPKLVNLLADLGIDANIAGVTSSREALFEENSVAISNIYRAKGNEAPMLYIVDAEYCMTGLMSYQKRNILFTGITRSNGWVRVTGVGDGMDAVAAEVREVKEQNYTLSFVVPSEEEMEDIRLIHQDISPRTRQKAERNIQSMQDLVEALDDGDLSPENVPAHLRKKLVGQLTRGENENSEGDTRDDD